MRGVWTLHPRRCSNCNHRWHYSGKCHKNLAKKHWHTRRECECKYSTTVSLKEVQDHIQLLNKKEFKLVKDQ